MPQTKKNTRSVKARSTTKKSRPTRADLAKNVSKHRKNGPTKTRLTEQPSFSARPRLKESEFTQEAAELCRLAGITKEQFLAHGIPMAELVKVEGTYSALKDAHQLSANHVAETLRSCQFVHSVRSRAKEVKSLQAKLLRKQYELGATDIRDIVQDLAGVRVIHLYKHEWREIDHFIRNNFTLHGKPEANHRPGDGEDIIKAYCEAGCVPKENPGNYRSVHYIVKDLTNRNVKYVEIQVRTIFEEGWSEINHQSQYPNNQNDRELALTLAAFNSVAGYLSLLRCLLI